MSKVKIPSWRSFEYVEVFLVTEWKDNCIYRTKSKGFAHRDRPKQENEVYASLSTKLEVDGTIELELIE